MLKMKEKNNFIGIFFSLIQMIQMQSIISSKPTKDWVLTLDLQIVHSINQFIWLPNWVRTYKPFILFMRYMKRILIHYSFFFLNHNSGGLFRNSPVSHRRKLKIDFIRILEIKIISSLEMCEMWNGRYYLIDLM